MAEDLLETMADTKGFRATAYPTGGESFEIGSNQINVLLALLLRRQREAARTDAGGGRRADGATFEERIREVRAG